MKIIKRTRKNDIIEINTRNYHKFIFSYEYTLSRLNEIQDFLVSEEERLGTTYILYCSYLNSIRSKLQEKYDSLAYYLTQDVRIPWYKISTFKIELKEIFADPIFLSKETLLYLSTLKNFSSLNKVLLYISLHKSKIKGCDYEKPFNHCFPTY